MRFVYPQGKRKALTFSYDDGMKSDGKLVGIFNQYGLKGTFHLNSGKLGDGQYLSAEEAAEKLLGHEIACHGVEHRNLPGLTHQQMVIEIGEDRKALEQITGRMVQGMSYAFGNYTLESRQIAASLGIKYSRTVQDTENFFPPADFMEWHPTCHHKNNLAQLGGKFLDIPGFYELPVMYVWGHSFEFITSQDWKVMEDFARMMAGMEDIWYATNIEICNYIQAVRRQEFSADGKRMYNPTAVSVWVSTDQGFVEVKPSEQKEI